MIKGSHPPQPADATCGSGAGAPLGVRRHMNDWLEAEQRVERAQQLSESQRWEEALAEIDVALWINPNNAAWHAHRGFILEELDSTEDAAKAYEAAYELDPSDRDVAVALGGTLARLDRFARALEVLDQLSRLYPDFEPAYCHRIGIYGELGRHDQAEEMFYLAQELNDSCPHCFFYMGTSLAARKQFDRAIYCWERVLDLVPDYIGVNRGIAQAYRAQGHLDRARESYLREIRDDPGNTDLLFELAEMFRESGQIATAAAKFAQIVELDPEHAQAHFALGKIQLLRGQPGQALACFEMAGKLSAPDPDPVGFDAKVGEAFLRLGRYAAARERLEVAVENDPGNLAPLIMLGDCLLAGGKVEDAADAFRRALAVDPDNAFAHQELGLCLVRQGHYGAGLEHCLHAVRAKPDFVAAMHTATLAHLRLAQWREARSMLRRALYHHPQNPVLRQLKKRLWQYRMRHYLTKLVKPFARAFGRPH